MKNLHLLIIGSSEEEIRANTLLALEEALKHHSYMGDMANCLSNEFEYEFVEEDCIAALFKEYLDNSFATSTD